MICWKKKNDFQSEWPERKHFACRKRLSCQSEVAALKRFSAQQCRIEESEVYAKRNWCISIRWYLHLMKQKRIVIVPCSEDCSQNISYFYVLYYIYKANYFIKSNKMDQYNSPFSTFDIYVWEIFNNHYLIWL